MLGLTEALGGGPLARRRPTVVVDMGLSPASFVLPTVGAAWEVDLITLRPFIDSERTLVTAEE